MLSSQKLSRGRLNHLVARASEQFETGLDAPALTDYFDGQMSQMQRTFAEMEREVTSWLPLLGTQLPIVQLHIFTKNP